ncbi:MAG: hypothetical protein EHM81_07665 [Chloroflexi bacterium]|nr:MAG: hypothetical protein EHM81_07665 [Chloroflexota bacterium]
MANTIIPIYTSRGDAEAFLVYPYLFNRQGEWTGFVTPQREVYSVLGYYVGALTNDPRILRKRSAEDKPRLKPPAAPPRLRVPSTIPLAKMMGALSFETIDVLENEPERLHTLDSGEFRQDMD